MSVERYKKDGRYINCYIDRKCYDALSAFCQKVGQSKTVALERAIMAYVNGDGLVVKSIESKESSFDNCPVDCESSDLECDVQTAG